MDDHCCTWYHAYWFDNPLRRLVQKQEKILGPYVKPGMTVLDMGCGMGYYSIAMAKMVGEQGRVISVDVQQEMLDVLMKRAGKAGVAGRITTRLAKVESMDIEGEADFAIAMWMFHEVPDKDGFLENIKAALKPGAKLLVAEPILHIDKARFEETVAKIESSGMKFIERPRVGLSRAAVFGRD